MLISINKNINHLHVGFLPLYKLRGKKPKLIFPIQFKHKYKYLKADFSSTFFFGRKKKMNRI